MQDLVFIGMTTPNNRSTANHYHDIWEAVYYTSGCGSLTIENENFTFHKGDLIVTPPGNIHYEKSEDGFDNIHFLFENFHPRFPGIIHVIDNESTDIGRALELMYKHFHMKQKNWQNVTEALLAVVFQMVVSKLGSKSLEPIVENIEKVLLKNISNSTFDINEYFSDNILSIDYMRKLFSKTMGRTPLQYLNSKRMDYAKTLLETRNLSGLKIKEIAKMTGFEDQYYFSKVFKQMTDKSPAEWKRDMKKEVIPNYQEIREKAEQ